MNPLNKLIGQTVNARIEIDKDEVQYIVGVQVQKEDWS